MERSEISGKKHTRKRKEAKYEDALIAGEKSKCAVKNAGIDFGACIQSGKRN